MIVASPEAVSTSPMRLAEELGVGVTFFRERIFPDGEINVRAESPDALRGEREVVLFFSLYPETSLRLVGLLQAIDVVYDYSPTAAVTLVIPYLVYARQDKRFLEGEAVSLRVLLRVFEGSGVEGLVSVDTHNPGAVEEYTEMWFCDVPATTEIARCAGEEVFKGKDFVLVSPDYGGVGRVRAAAEVLGLRYTYLRKERDRHTGEVSIQPAEPDLLRGRSVLLLDDVVSTGGTLVRAAEALKRIGVKKLVAGATHLLLLDRADERLFDAGYAEIIGSNTVDTPYSRVSVEGLIADAIRGRRG